MNPETTNPRLQTRLENLLSLVCKLVLILVAGGIFGRLWFPDLNGVTQRVAYFGIYLWMLVIVREIELGRRPKASEAPILSENATGLAAATL